MKSTLILTLLLLVGYTGAAQRTTYRLDIQKGGEQLEIRIDREDHGKELHYARTVDVQGMNQAEKLAVIREILHAVQFEGNEVRAGQDETIQVASVSPLPAKGSPISKLMEEDAQAGRVKVSYQYIVDGIEHSYERTFNRENRTEAEIQRLIVETEESIGFPMGNS